MEITYTFRRLLLALIFIVPLVLPLSATATATATVWVGVGSGKITVQQTLMPGGIYNLPPVPVLNTGSQKSTYLMSIEYLQNQPEREPPKAWFAFSPKTFSLKSQGVKSINITLTIPVKTKPGNYFAYIQVHPVQINTSGQTRINIAAAAKLYFTVAPANIFQAIYYRSLSFITQYAPWTYIIFGLIALVILIKLFRRFFSFNIGLSVKKKD